MFGFGKARVDGQSDREEERAPRRGGFFTTDAVLPYRKDVKESIQIAEMAKRTFQRSDKDFKAVGKDGELVAMDEAYPDLQLAKIQNNLYGFLPLPLMSYYASNSFIGYQASAMIAQHWLIDKACTMPAQDAVRHGYEISTVDDEEIDPRAIALMKKRDKAFRIKKHCTEFVKMGRVFGIRIAMFDIVSSDPLYYEKPFNPDGIMPNSYKGISQIDPYWITPELDTNAAANPASQHFYEPTWWRVNGKRVHRTHLVIMRNGELADILKPTYFYGGIPVPQKIAEHVFAAERTSYEAPQLAMTKRLTVLKTDLSQVLANLTAFQGKMEQWTEIMNNYGIKIVGEGEEIEQYDTALADLDEVIMTQYQIVAAAADVPATKLLGTSPKGFGASGDYEQDSYHEFLESMQEENLTPLVERHHICLIRSEIAPKLGIKPFHTEVSWRPTDTPTAKELAEINLLKAQRDTALVTAGGIDGTDVRDRIVKDADSDYNGIPEIVPNGPGDREHEQEMQALALEAKTESPGNKKPQQDALESEFKGAFGVLGE